MIYGRKNDTEERDILDAFLIKGIPLNQNKDIRAKIVSIYEEVRDYPFKIQLDRESGDYCYDLKYVQMHKKGSCSQKHYFLGSIYENFGLSVGYLTYPFYWYELIVNFPDFLQEIVKKLPMMYHLAIQLSFEKESFLLDASWDSSLGKAGFPINKIGGKLQSTNLAIVPAGNCLIHSSIGEREEFIKTINNKRGKISQEEIKFFTLFNNWLEDLRKIKTE